MSQSKKEETTSHEEFESALEGLGSYKNFKDEDWRRYQRIFEDHKPWECSRCKKRMWQAIVLEREKQTIDVP